jgi:hypothetical protein
MRYLRKSFLILIRRSIFAWLIIFVSDESDLALHALDFSYMFTFITNDLILWNASFS